MGIFNGIDASTGNYLYPPLTRQQIAAIATDLTNKDKDRLLNKLFRVFKHIRLGLPMDADPVKLAEAGWAVVFAKSCPEDVKRALEPLIAHRKKSTGETNLKILEYDDEGDISSWLKKYGAYPGDIRPEKVPYYILLIGGPTEIPFDFQLSLDLEYAVGRLELDSAEEYDRYAKSVLQYETQQTVGNKKQVAFWGTSHPKDEATKLSAEYLIRNLAAGLPAYTEFEHPPSEGLGFNTRLFEPQDSTKQQLARLLSEEHPPAILMSASHGVGWLSPYDEQESVQGALLCQDWPGPGNINPEHYFAASDCTERLNVSGMFLFLFACFSAATPLKDSYPRSRNMQRETIAKKPFVAALPKRLLSHSNGTALAVIGHLERAWSFSIRPPGTGPQIRSFWNFLRRLLRGEPVGHAAKDFNEKAALMSGLLIQLLDQKETGNPTSDEDIATTWIERNDAQNYILLGDPAARVRVNNLIP